MKLINAEAKKAGISVAEALEISASKSWGGFEAAWLQEKKTSPKPSVKPQVVNAVTAAANGFLTRMGVSND